ncbi:Hpt domain-containing protein [Paenibacillus caui]|uniref:Hpt domain-containing protein n=1 Tax=Paenibacillus caui TaxID=2873927 RepID=UPI001CA9D51C|nr:Hpt domain-containing protein [Paenibacillus caui]
MELSKSNYTVHIDIDLEELIPAYLEKRRKDIQTIEAALGSDDFETIRVIGHSAKGSGAGYGFDLITEVGAQIELAAKAQNQALIRDNLETLADFLDHVVVIFDEEDV